MNRIVKMILLVGCFLGIAEHGASQPSQQISPEWRFKEARQFDFWLGQWNVNLRTRQSDNTWQNSVRAEAKIYSILDGKAVLELWNSGSIKGYSLRYFDEKKGKWVLWLDWPNHNRSDSSTLEGSFRHGRVEFFTMPQNGSWFDRLLGREPVSRYTFSDITASSLRWDDAHSTDGGESWQHSWIMEFSRTGTVASWPENGTQAHTYESGGLCDMPEFGRLEGLAGRWSGEVRVRGSEEARSSSAATMTGYQVLDGCGVITFLTFEQDGRTVKRFNFRTFSTERGEFEDTVLDNQRGSGVRLFYGPDDGQALHLVTDGKDGGRSKFVWHMPGSGQVSYEQFYSAAGDTGWHKSEIGTFRRFADGRSHATVRH